MSDSQQRVVIMDIITVVIMVVIICYNLSL